MTIDPQIVYGVFRAEKLIHVRLDKGVADACLAIEKQMYGEDVKVVPMMLTEVADGDK